MDRQRFEALYPSAQAESTRILLVGCGGIGSYTAAILARMGIGSITLVDFDFVEETNIATQDMEVGDIGTAKTVRLMERLARINPDMHVTEHVARFGPHHLNPGAILITAVDSIKARQDIYRIFEAKATPGQILIDPRMSAEGFELWVIRRGGALEADYVRGLFDPTPRPDLPCGARAIAYTGAFAAAVTASAVRRAVMEPAYETWVVGDIGAMGLRVLLPMLTPQAVGVRGGLQDTTRRGGCRPQANAV
jgi:sulfur carrier protein ThiS adenylyltransferase